MVSNRTARTVVRPRRETATFWEIILPFLRNRRLQREADAEERYEQEVKRAWAEFQNAKAEYVSGEREVIESYMDGVHWSRGGRRLKMVKENQG